MLRFATTAVLAMIGVLSFAGAASAQHATVSPDQLKWAAAPPAFPKGAQIAVLAGDPTKEGLYVARLKVPAGYKVPPHMHPADENITVISGSFNVGMGEKFDDKNGPGLKAGGFAHVSKGMAHYAWFTEDSIIQIHGMGPAVINYINPADDPRKGI